MHPNLSQRRRAAGALLTLGLLVALGACGKKGDPSPPIRLIPAKSTDLAVQQRGTELRLEVGYPASASNGMALPGVEAVEVWRLLKSAPGGRAPEVQDREFDAAAKKDLEITGNELTSATEGDRIVLRLPMPAAEETPRAYVYGVRFRSTEGEVSQTSNLSILVPRAAPAAPRLTSVEGEAEGVRLRWESPGSEVAGYRIYRRPAETRSYGKAIGQVTGDLFEYLDGDAEMGRRYFYSVTSLAGVENATESERGGEREVDYQDRFPPAAPQGLVALAEAAQVRLRWEAVDAASYTVYRRVGEGPFRALNSAPLTTTQYLDRELRPGMNATYRVTATDAAGNEGPPSAVATAEAR